MKELRFVIVVVAFFGLNEATGQWNTNGSHIYNTNSGNVGIGINSPSTLLHVGKNATEPVIRIQNFGGNGGATFQMIDNGSGADWKFKATLSGGFKIRDNANGLDVITIESNSFANAITIKSSGNIGIGTASPDGSALVDMSSTSKGFLPPRMTTAERDLISSPAEGLTVFNTVKNCNETYNGYAWVSNTHYLGESYGGGIVFWVVDWGQHGLIAATTDQSSGIQWYNGINRVTATRWGGWNAGSMYTAMIIAMQMADNQSGNFAAKVCVDYSVTVDGYVIYADWYLPSEWELNVLYIERNTVGGFAEDYYWSSSEYTSSRAYIQHFWDGEQTEYLKSSLYCVRCIRSF